MRFFSLAALAVVTLTTTSCELFKPKDQAAAYDPYGAQAQTANPYGQVPASNPYGQPAAPNPYAQTPAPNPYGSYEQPQTYTAPPSSAPTPSYSGGGATGSGRTVTVQSGDTLTALAKRNGTSVSALRSANGLSGDLIRVGQKLRLP